MTDDSLLDQLAEEFTQRVRERKPPDVEEFASRYPQLAGRIRELFPTLMLLERSGCRQHCRSRIDAISAFCELRLRKLPHRTGDWPGRHGDRL